MGFYVSQCFREIEGIGYFIYIKYIHHTLLYNNYIMYKYIYYILYLLYVIIYLCLYLFHIHTLNVHTYLNVCFIYYI